MKKKIIVSLLITALSATVAFANAASTSAVSVTDLTADETATAETIEEALPQIEVLDENGNVEEVLTFELVNTYYVNPDAAVLNGAATQSLVTPNPNTNYYDLSNGKYYLYTGQSQTVYEMDKWFHANSSGYLYISAYVVDADATLKFYKYKYDNDTHFWLIREYVLNVNPNNSRTRVYNSPVKNLDKTGSDYYTFLVTSTGNSFSTGLLQASWSNIEDPYDYH